MVCFVFSWKAISDSHKKMPNFLSEIKRQDAYIQSSLKEVNQLLDAVAVPANTSLEEIKRLQDQKKKERIKEQEQRTQDRLQMKQKLFIRKKQKRFNDGLSFLIWGCLICLLGASVINVRYDKGTRLEDS